MVSGVGSNAAPLLARSNNVNSNDPNDTSVG
jgi:hypothetical protein